MIALRPHAAGTVLPIRAQPGARRNELRGSSDGRLKVSVTQIAEKGKANKALLDLLSKALSLRKSQIELLCGETSPKKDLLIRDLTPDELARRIEHALQ